MKLDEIIEAFRKNTDGNLKGFSYLDIARAYFEASRNQEKFAQLSDAIIDNHVRLGYSRDLGFANVASMVASAEAILNYGQARLYQNVKGGDAEVIRTLDGPVINAFCEYAKLNKNALADRVAEINKELDKKEMN